MSEVKIIDQDISNYDESREGASSGGGAAVKRDSISSLAESIASVVSTLSGVGADSDGGGGGGGQDPNKPICVSCGSDVVTLVCRECSYFICDNCNKKVNTESSTDWFLRDEGLKRCFMETEQWSNLVEKQPTLRLWCLVEMQAAIKYKKAIILKVGEHVLSDMPSEHEKPATPTRLKKKNKKVSSRKLKSAAALEALDTEKKRLPRPFSGKVTFQPPSRQALSIFLLNLSSIINHSEAAFSLPDDLEREMLLLGNETLTIDEAISTVVTSSAFEYISPEVEAYLCGEREALRCLPQSKVYAAFDSAASGGRIDVMCELLASRPQNVGDLSYHLNRCAMKGRLGSMLFLLNYGADVNAPSYGRTPLTNAVENGQVDAVAMLLDKGADVNTDAGGRGTALWWAATSNNPTLVQMLLDAGADPELASLGQTPLMVAAAAAGDSDEVVTMLKLATQ